MVLTNQTETNAKLKVGTPLGMLFRQGVSCARPLKKPAFVNGAIRD
jgi:hypothetical protein